MARDIADPQLHNILFPGPDPDNSPPGFLRDKCEIVADGWYANGVVAKVKTIMRAKIQALMEGRVPDDAEFENLANLPDRADTFDDVGRLFTFDPKQVSNKEMMLATEIRSAIKWSTGWRGLRKEKIEQGKKVAFREKVEVEEEEEEEEREVESEGDGEGEGEED